MPLDMRTEATQARQNLAYAMANRGFPLAVIMAQTGYSSLEGVKRALKAGEARAEELGRYSDRRFGVEIEFNGCSRSRVVEIVRERYPNIVCEVQSYNHTVREYWKIVTDSSVNGNGGSYDDYGEGAEMVSPILQGEQSFKDLRNSLTAIKDAGGEVDGSCGLHVHHDARDLDGHSLAAMIALYVDNQLAVDELLAPVRRSHRRNQWCRPVSDSEAEQLKRLARNNEHGYGFGNWDRYRTVNVTSFPRYGSIEFRQHQGTLNFDKIKSWVQFGQAIVEAAIKIGNGDVPKFDSHEPMLDWLVANGGLPKPSARFLKMRAAHYASRQRTR